MTETDSPRNPPPDLKAILLRYYRKERAQFLAKLDGLGERDIRWPVTATGTNLLGLVKHVGSVQLGYFAETFDRPSDLVLPWFDTRAELDADMWATAEETRGDLLTFFAASSRHADATMDELDLDAPGAVPWWPEERRRVTLGQIIVHMLAELSRHAGHADICRELLDQSAGNNDGNLPDRSAEEWAAYRKRLEDAAVAAAAGTGG